MIALRETTPADAEAILALRRRCFPEDDIAKDFPVARAFIAEAEGRPVAHLAFADKQYVLEGRAYSAALAMDAMTDPAYRRQGLFSRVAGFARDSIRGDYAFSTAWQIRPSVLPAMVTNGWAPVLRAPVFVRPLWRAAPSGAAFQSGDNDATSARFAAPWYTTLRTSDAHVVTRETTLKGYRTLAIADLSGPARPLLKEAFAQARRRGINLAAALLSWRHPSLPLLLRMGFLPSPHRFRFLVNVFDPRFDPRRVRWALSWADTDHL